MLEKGLIFHPQSKSLELNLYLIPFTHPTSSSTDKNEDGVLTTFLFNLSIENLLELHKKIHTVVSYSIFGRHVMFHN